MNDTRYKHLETESKWQQAWEVNNAFATPQEGDPYYVLEMFPYPSGALHMGHVRNYTIGDVLARYQRMQGKRVLHPMGWDALGLPAENKAIEEGVAPQVRTPKNIASMKEQMTKLGLSYDWSHEIGTYLPEYYRWNQWFFLQMLEKGLVYRRESNVNWCPGCNTVLANEQVNDNGTCWRDHPDVTTKTIPEWAFKITDYAQELLDDLSKLTDWPQRIVSMQRNWIGRSEGARITFKVVGSEQAIDIFTTRVDTIYGCTYMVLAPEHPLTMAITTMEQQEVVSQFIEVQRKIEGHLRIAEGAPKEGVFTGAMAINPYTQKEIPIWIANFVLAEYGTGAVMSVPAHDHRDFEFAKKYELPMVPVIRPVDGALDSQPAGAFTDNGVLVDSGDFTTLDSATARTKMADHAAVNHFGEKTINWHLRDWGFSRQRYWGTPIPIVYCDDCGTVPLPETELPVILPDYEKVNLLERGKAPLAQLPSFYEVNCPRCHKFAKRETETMDTFVDSAWYFARFLSPSLTSAPFSSDDAKTWLPVDIYVGGPEHAVMHLLYFRFWTKVMRDMGLVSIDEPVKRLITQGMVNATAYSCPQHGYVDAAIYGKKQTAEQVCPKCAEPLVSGVVKMGKSKKNGTDPLVIIEKYGADTARLYTLFAAPPQKDMEWDSRSIEGLSRFISRIYRVALIHQSRCANTTPCQSMQGLSGDNKLLRGALHRTLQKVTHEMGEEIHFNTAIAAMMELVNTLYDTKLHQEENASVSPEVVCEVMQVLAQMLSPLAPYFAEELWAMYGANPDGKTFVAHSIWPVIDTAACVRDTITMAVQVMGKVRGEIEVPAEIDKESALAQGKVCEKVVKYLEGKTIVKEIFVPKRLINFVVK